MNRLIKSTLWISITAILLGTSSLNAQNTGGTGNRRNRTNQAAGGNQGNNRGNFDPAQMRQRQMDRYKEVLGVTNDDEWKVIQEHIQKVLDARREVGSGAMAMMAGGRRGGAGGGAGGGNPPAGGQDANAQRRAGGPNAAPANPAATELQKALDDNAATDVINAKLAGYRDSRKAAEAKLEQAQADLQKIVTRKQEARLVLMGLLK